MSMGVPLTIRSQSIRAIVRASSRGLLLAVAHGRQDLVEVIVLPERLLDAADRVGPRIDDLGGAVLLGGHDARAVLHPAVGQGRAVLDDQDPLAGDPLRRPRR